MNSKVKLKTTKVVAKKVQPKQAKSSAVASRASGVRQKKSKVPIKHVEGVEIKVEDTISSNIEKLHKNPQKELEAFIASLTSKGVEETVKFKPKAKIETTTIIKENSISVMTTISPGKENAPVDSKVLSKEAEKGDQKEKEEEEEEESFHVIVDKTTEKKEKEDGGGGKQSAEAGEESTTPKSIAEKNTKAKAKEKQQAKGKVDQAAAKSDQVLKSFAEEPKSDGDSIGELHKLINDITKNIEKTRKSRKTKVAAPAAAPAPAAAKGGGDGKE